MFRRVLVPLDGSGFAEAALPLAAAVVRATVAELELVSATDPLPPAVTGGGEVAGLAVPVAGEIPGAIPVTTQEYVERLRTERTTYLHETARRLREHLEVEAGVVLADDRPDRAVLRRVEETGADLVVMATHGRGPLERAWLGSVTDRVVRQLHVPVLLVRPVAEERPDLAAAPGVRRVVVALDGSELAEAGLKPAARLAKALGVPVTLLRAVGGRLELESPYIPHAAQAYQEHLDTERREASEYLGGAAEAVASYGARLGERLVVEGNAARAILDAADRDGDVVAMATHGRGGLKRLILGSVSDKVVRGALMPVLLVPPENPD
jgi:nucleotide-binding universal stress UspA family protein